VITKHIDILRPLKQATKRLKGRGTTNLATNQLTEQATSPPEARPIYSPFRAVAEIILVFEYLLRVYEDRLQLYESVMHDEHNKSPEDYLAINLRAALLKLHKYYNKLNLSPAYYATTILHPRYKHFLNTA
jgi:hypothetical protein